MFTHFNSPIIVMLFGCVVVLASCCGMCAVLIGWRGKVAALCLGSLVLLGGLAVLVSSLYLLPRYWWLSLPPILLGIQSIRIWRHEQRTPKLRLSALFLVVAFVGTMCAGAGQLYRQRLAERSLVQRLESLIKGQVERDFDGFAIGLILYEAEEELLDEIFSLLVQLPYIQRLQVNHCHLSEEQAAQIGGLVNLRQLWLQSTNIGNKSLSEFRRLEKLETLDLMDTQITGAGLMHLWDMRSMRHLWLSKTGKISPTDVEQLRTKLPDLQVSF